MIFKSEETLKFKSKPFFNRELVCKCGFAFSSKKYIVTVQVCVHVCVCFLSHNNKYILIPLSIVSFFICTVHFSLLKQTNKQKI